MPASEKHQAPSSNLEKGSSRRQPCTSMSLWCLKFGASLVLGAWCLVLFTFTGCTPPGPGALLAGQRLVEQGKYPQAVKKLKTATSLLPTNAQAWNYMGLAYHYAGQAAEAES